MIEVYRPSGKFSSMILWLAVPWLFVLCAVAWVYQGLVEWIPFIYAAFLLTLGFAFAAGFIAGSVVRWVRCRNIGAALLVTAIVTLAAVGAGHYFSYINTTNGWAEELITVAGEGEAPITGAEIRSGLGFGEFMQLKIETGWTIGRAGAGSGDGGAFSGVFVYLIWLTEAGILLIGGLVGAHRAVTRPYCETCDAWTEDGIHTFRHSQPSEQALDRIAAAEYPDDLLHIPVEPGPSGPTDLVYSLRGCPTCDQSAFLTVQLVTATTNKKGEQEVKTQDLWTDVALPPEQLEALHDLGARVEEASASLAAEAESPKATGSDPDLDSDTTPEVPT